ncbi:MAG: hypothetical protein H7A55_01840 [Verrucomicrobiaceae bacterium]|nr:hypothetical protein [Verrucomicrobiaceae bacterium]
MFQRFLPIALLISLGLLSSCSTTNRAIASKGALAGYRTASVEARPDDSGDVGILQEIRTELSRRGYGIVQQGAPGRHLVARIGDTWRWDLVMYLYSLEIEFIDSSTGAIAAVADYRNSAFHTFPDRRKVVRDLFAQLDAKGVFAK